LPSPSPPAARRKTPLPRPSSPSPSPSPPSRPRTPEPETPALLSAIDAAGLKETLSGAGPFTVFAPTDEAFAKIPKAQLDKLIKDKKKLAAVLTYHVVPGAVMAADVSAMATAKTVNGAEITINAANGVKINDATVISADIATTNGVIHVIDTVLMPPKAR
jgi:uncharacterized surface protein with fasciclin (FAS1) repeats